MGTKRGATAKPPGKERRKKRFVFKSFSQRLEEVDIDVFRSLDAVKFEPTEGSSFFHESLVQWRELNAAADFMSAYEELLPLVQTLPQLLLHKKVVLNRLLRSLQPSALLSFQPILSLVAVLSRDLGEDFLPFLPQVFDSFVELLRQGCDADASVLEMVFTSVSYMFKYLLKFLSTDLLLSLKITRRLRYYHQPYVRLFAVEAVSFLLKNAPVKELIKGVRKTLAEAESDPSEERLSSCSDLLFYTLRGPSNAFHSRAGEVLKLLLNPSVMGGIRKEHEGGDVVLKVIKKAFCSLCEDFERDKLQLLWSTVVDELHSVMALLEKETTKEITTRVLHFLLLINTMLEFKRGRSINDYGLFVDLASRLLFLVPKVDEGVQIELRPRIFTFLLNLYRSHWHVVGSSLTAVDLCSPPWSSAFESSTADTLLPFIKGLLDFELTGQYVAVSLSTISRLIDSSKSEVLPLLLIFLQKTQTQCMKRHQQHFDRISSSVSDLIATSLDKLRRKEAELQPTEDTALALQCFPYLSQTSLCLDYATAVDDLFEIGTVSGADMWECLLGTALLSHLQVLIKSGSDLTALVPSYLQFALKYKTSPEVLQALADLLDTTSLGERAANHLNSQDIKSLEANLATPNSIVRLATLRILSWYESLAQHSQKLLPELISVESSPLDLEHSRRCSTLISQIRLNVEAKKVPSHIISMIFRSVVGLLHIRFAVLWDPAIDCLVSIVNEYGGPLREDLLLYLTSAQEQCLNRNNTIDEEAPTEGLLGSWRSQRRDPRPRTPVMRVLTSLLQVAQKAQGFIDAKSDQLLSLFFAFTGSKDEKSGFITGNDWKALLKEWLALLEHLKGVRTLSQAPVFKQMLLNRFLSYSDPDIQSKALGCLLNWKDTFLTAYKDRLNNLIAVDKVHDELMTWDIARDSEGVAGEHRQCLIPVLLRILYPKMTKRGKAGKSARAGARSPVLSFLSHLEPSELATFFMLIFDPLGAAINAEGNELVAEAKSRWRGALEQGCTDSFVNWVDAKAAMQLPHKRKVGFLYLAKDLLGIFSGEQIEPYLPAILAFVLRILESAPVHAEDSKEEAESDAKDNAGKRKDIRGLCLKFVSSLLSRFENVKCGSEYWDLFFTATEHSIRNMRQENARSSQPSALLACILALSRNSDHATLLLRKPDLVPNVLSVVVPTAVDDQAPVVRVAAPVRSAVLGIVESLVNMQNDEIYRLLEPHLEMLIKGLASQLSSEKRIARDSLLVQRQLRILSHLVQFLKDSQVPVFLDALLPFFTAKKHVPAEVSMEVLKITNRIPHPFDFESITKCLEALCSLFANMAHHEARDAACQLLQKIAQQNSSFSLLAELIEDLNSMSTSAVGEPDFDRRQKAYEKMNDKFYSACSREEARLLLSQLVFDLQSDDMRYNASSCLLSFVKATGKGILQQAVEFAVQDYLLSQFRAAMKSEDVALRMEWLIVFRQLVNCASVKKISEFKCLTSSDQEGDFFSNIVHIQAHRKVKAMAKFRAECSAGNFSQDALTKVFVPLFMHSLFESKGQNDGIVDAVVETLGVIAGQLGWSSYFSLLMRCFYLLATKGDYQKTLVRLICIILTKILSHFNTRRIEGAPLEEDRSRAVVEALQRSVLPELEKLMLKKDSVNVPIALATVNVLKLMPQEVMERELPRVVQTVTNLLRSRVQDTRDEARSALVGIAEALGASYLQFILKTLQASLRRGYERHVLGFTVNAILIRTVPKMQVGELDYCLKELLAITEDEIFGEVAEEKEVQELANKMKERKQARSYDSLRLVAQAVTFRQSIEQLLDPARKTVTSAKMQEKVRGSLKSIAAGVQANVSATDGEVLALSRRLLEEFLNQEAARSQAPAGTTSPERNLHLLAEFGLQLLHLVLKNTEANQQPDAEMVVLLDPFVGLLQKCLLVKFEGVISAALKSLYLLSRLPLPSIDTFGAQIASRVFVIAGTSSNAENPVLQACLKLITTIVRCWKSLSLSDDQVHLLLQLPVFIDLEGAHALSLLKAIVERKLLVPEIYDLMDRVQLLMVTSQVPSIQKRSSEVLLQFLLDYPLGEKRLRHHLNCLLTNLGYEHISGREAALEMLHTVITKFPVAAWEAQAESFFLTLVTRLANEKTDHVRVLLETAIKVLMKRVEPLILERMLQFSLSWMKGEKRALWFPAAQITGLLIDVMDSKFKSYLPDFLPALSNLLRRSSPSGDWREPYYVLLVYEKLALLFPNDDLHRQQDLWALLSGLLVHKQNLVMSKSSQLFTIYLEQHRQEALLSDASWVLLLASRFCQQLDSEAVDQELGTLACTNLSLLVPLLHSMPLVGTSNNVGEQQQARLQKALLLLLADTALDNPPALLLVLRKLEKTALQYRVIQTSCIFRWYSSFIAQLGGKDVVSYLPTILGPLLKISDSTEASGELKKLAEEVRNDIRSRVAAESFAQAHSEVTQKMKMRKEKRKQAQSITALVDPEKHAKKKIRLGLKKKVQKRRKRAEFGKRQR